LAWGLGLFLHYVGGVLGPKWREEAQKDASPYQQKEEEPYFSSEYKIEDEPKPQRDREDWDGIDVSIHDVDD